MKPRCYISVTEASTLNNLLLGELGLSSIYPNSSRSIPYAEVYNLRTGIMETPAEHIQRAAEDEAKRRAKLTTNNAPKRLP